MTVAVDIADAPKNRVDAGREVDGRAKRAVSIPEQNRDK